MLLINVINNILVSVDSISGIIGVLYERLQVVQ